MDKYLVENTDKNSRRKAEELTEQILRRIFHALLEILWKKSPGKSLEGPIWRITRQLIQ